MSNKDKLYGGERQLIGQWKLQCELMTLEKKIYELFWSGDHSTIDEIIDNPVEDKMKHDHEDYQRAYAFAVKYLDDKLQEVIANEKKVMFFLQRLPATIEKEKKLWYKKMLEKVEHEAKDAITGLGFKDIHKAQL